MDPFTIAGSLATVVQLASYGIDFALTMNKLLRQLGTVQEEIDDFVSEVKISSLSITLARNVLDDYHSNHPDSESLRFISSKNVLVGLGDMSKKTKRRLEGAEVLLISMKSRLKLITLIKWTLRKDSLLAVSSKLKGIQNTMSVLMNAVQLEGKASKMNKIGRSGSREDRAEIKKLKEEIEILRKGMVCLITAMERESARSTSRSERRLLESLVQLGKNATKPLEISPSSPTQPDSPSHRRSHSGTAGTSSLNSSRVSSAGRELESLRRQSRLHTVPSPTSTKSDDPDDHDMKLGLQQSIASVETYPVEPARVVLNISDDLSWQAVVGEVSPPSSSRRTVPERWTAQCYHGLDRNVISLDQARHLGLPDPVLDDTDVEIMIDVGNGKPTCSLGRTMLEWRGTVRSSMHEPVLTLECEVCDRYDQSGRSGLWLGKPFIEASSSRSSRR